MLGTIWDKTEWILALEFLEYIFCVMKIPGKFTAYLIDSCPLIQRDQLFPKTKSIPKMMGKFLRDNC